MIRLRDISEWWAEVRHAHCKFVKLSSRLNERLVDWPAPEFNSLQSNSRVEKTTGKNNDSFLRGTNSWAFEHLKCSTDSSNIDEKNENCAKINYPGSYVPRIPQVKTRTELNLNLNKNAKKKDPRYPVDFFKVQLSSANDPGVNTSPSHFKAIAHLS